MSACIVGPKTIARVTATLSHTDWKPLGHELFPSTNFTNSTEVYALAVELLALNTAAVNQRYGESDPTFVDHEDEKEFRHEYVNELFTFALALRSEEDPTPWFQASKSLSCLLYQCSEGDIPKTELFKKLTAFEGTLNTTVIHKLPAYDEAEWG
jgi:hypothetical protein